MFSIDRACLQCISAGRYRKRTFTSGLFSRCVVSMKRTRAGVEVITMDCVCTPSPVKRIPCKQVAVGHTASVEYQVAFLLRFVLHRQAPQDLAVQAR